MLKTRIDLVVERRMVRPLRSIRRWDGVIVRSSRCRWFGLCFGRARLCWHWGRCVGCVCSAACSVAEHCATQISHCAGGPPGVAETVEEVHALLELFSCAVNVDFEAAGTEVAVHDAEGTPSA